MNKTFKTIEEAADAMKNAMWVSNGDPALLEDRMFAEEIAHDFLEYTDGTMRELLPNEDAWGMGNDFEDAKERLGLKDNVVRHIYVWSEDGVTNYIAFTEDWDYAEEEREIYHACIKKLGRMPFGEDFATFKDAQEYVCRNVGSSDTAEISCDEIGGRWYYEGSNVGSHSGAFIVNYGRLYTEEEWSDR